jgi:hypothetical protein
VIQCERLLLSPDIPNSDKPATASGCKNVGNFLVPVQCRVFIWVCSSLSEAECLRLVVEVVNVKLALGACSSEDVRSVGVELECLDGTGVLVNLLNLSVSVGCQNSCCLLSGICPNPAPVRSFSASQSINAPLSSAPAIIPLGYCSLGWLQAISLNLQRTQFHFHSCKQSLAVYLDSTFTVAIGSSSTPCSASSSLSSQSSSCVSPEKSASTAPDLVPVAINGWVGPGDQANVAVRGISRRRTMVGYGRTEAVE